MELCELDQIYSHPHHNMDFRMAEDLGNNDLMVIVYNLQGLWNHLEHLFCPHKGASTLTLLDT